MAIQYRLYGVGVDADRDLQAWTLRDRQYSLIIETTGPEGTDRKEIGAPDAETNIAPHISFSVERTDGVALNLAQVRLWNISKDTAQRLLKAGAKIYLRAGYGDRSSLPLIFEGTVKQMVETLSGADRIYTIEAVDGFQEFANTFISASFVKGSTLYQMLTELARQVGVPILFSKAAEEHAKRATITKGYSFYGKTTIVFEQATTGYYVWRFESGVLIIKMLSENNEMQNVVYAAALTPLTGLIGMPERIYESSVTYDENVATDVAYTIMGYRVQFFMNGALQINDPVYLESREASGAFEIFKMTISGDNLGGDWTCTADLREYAPQGG